MRYRPGFCGINLALMCGANDVALTTETSSKEKKEEREKERDSEWHGGSNVVKKQKRERQITRNWREKERKRFRRSVH